jgi:hypothetical protein
MDAVRERRSRKKKRGLGPGSQAGGADLTAFEGPWYKGDEVRRYGPRHQGGLPADG